MSATTLLRGITWGHSRGFLPMVATAQRYSELHPEVRVVWELRSLQQFADQSIETLAQQYDLLVVDHPSSGEAAAHGLVIPLDQHLSADFMADQARNSVGASHISYCVQGHQWTLATDAATPVSAARLDVLQRHGCTVPQTWDELLELARRGLVAFAGLKLDCLMYWYALCINEGEEPFLQPQRIVDPEVGTHALLALKELADACGSESLQRNPIATYELLTRTNRFGYSPMAYGYSNYARASYVAHPLRFGGLVQRKGKTLTSTLGGAGLAISSRCTALAQAVDYARFVASAEVQRGLYTAMGGQPGHRLAWLDEENNRISGNFFADTLPTLDNAYLRPRYPGYIEFQERAPDAIAQFLRGEHTARQALAELERLDQHYRVGRIDERHAGHGGTKA
jgi:multiple sugar transport system substrate-binding protein